MISLCLCTYNGEKFIRKQLDSILQQTKVPNEIIVVDDASTDNTFPIILEYAKQYPSIHWATYRNEKNLGWRANFKLAIDHSSGDIVFLSDQDDIWMEKKIENMVEVLSKNLDLELIACDYILRYDDGKTTDLKAKSKEKLERIPANYPLAFTTIHPGCTMAFKKSLIPDFDKAWEPSEAHDRTLCTLAFAKGSLALYHEPLIYWYHHSSSASLVKSSYFSQECYNYKLEEVASNLVTCNYLKPYATSDRPKFQKNFNKYYRFSIKHQKFYDHPTIFRYLGLMKYRRYYRTWNSYFIDLIAFKYRKAGHK